MNLRPLGDRILVKVAKADNVTKGGIILASAIKEKQKEGVVVSLGKKKEGEFQTKVGDKVLFSSHAGTEVKMSEEEQLLIMREDEVMAVIG